MIGQWASLAAQPGDRARGYQIVKEISAEGMADEVARRIEIGKSVFLHLLGQQPIRMRPVELSVEMPFALVRRVIAGIAQHMADGRDSCRQILDPWRVTIFKHPVVSGLQSGQQHRPRGCAHHRWTVMVEEADAAALQTLVAGE